MKKELIITIIIIIAIIILGNITLGYTENVIKEANEKLEKLKDDILSENIDKEKLNNKMDEILIFEDNEMDEIYDYWLEKDKTLSLYLEHDEIEKVNIYLKNTKGHIEGDDVYGSLGELEACIATLSHIEEKQAVNLKNIF